MIPLLCLSYNEIKNNHSENYDIQIEFSESPITFPNHLTSININFGAIISPRNKLVEHIGQIEYYQGTELVGKEEINSLNSEYNISLHLNKLYHQLSIHVTMANGQYESASVPIYYSNEKENNPTLEMKGLVFSEY